jgi:NTE family protein
MKPIKSWFRNRSDSKLGIVLSGGGARGFAHAGILKALNEKGFYPDIISGVSAGAIVGALYADGHSPDEILKIFSQNDSFFKYVKFTVPRKSLFRAEGLRQKLSTYLEGKSFDDLEKPLYVAATNINNGKINYFQEGPVLDAVLASAAIPVLFDPVEIGGDLYVDGGVLDNFPLAPLQKQCKKVIGVSLNPIHREEDFTNLLSIAERTFRLSVSSSLHLKVRRCSLVFEPQELGEFGLLDAAKGKEMFEIGYRTTLDKLSGEGNQELNLRIL